MIILENEEFMKKSWIILGTLFVLGGVLLLFFSFEKKEIILKQEKNSVESEEKMNKNVSLQVNGKTFKITLEENETTEELTKGLPLKMIMNELNGNEKYYDLNTMLPSNPTKVEEIKTGDVMLYNNNCLVIFYKDFKTTYSYTRIGKIENTEGLREALGTSSVEVEIN